MDMSWVSLKVRVANMEFGTGLAPVAPRFDNYDSCEILSTDGFRFLFDTNKQNGNVSMTVYCNGELVVIANRFTTHGPEAAYIKEQIQYSQNITSTEYDTPQMTSNRNLLRNLISEKTELQNQYRKLKQDTDAATKKFSDEKDAQIKLAYDEINDIDETMKKINDMISNQKQLDKIVTDTNIPSLQMEQTSVQQYETKIHNLRTKQDELRKKIRQLEDEKKHFDITENLNKLDERIKKIDTQINTLNQILLLQVKQAKLNSEIQKY